MVIQLGLWLAITTTDRKTPSGLQLYVTRVVPSAILVVPSALLRGRRSFGICYNKQYRNRQPCLLLVDLLNGQTARPGQGFE